MPLIPLEVITYQEPWALVDKSYIKKIVPSQLKIFGLVRLVTKVPRPDAWGPDKMGGDEIIGKTFIFPGLIRQGRAKSLPEANQNSLDT